MNFDSQACPVTNRFNLVLLLINLQQQQAIDTFF